ncbi:hypothetical protein DPEC_G00145810 [Dallia pectoralis]|uniref:Uncharacterized protein n=1 Tax=Dallia pectoralis TaxID=75939 RepID=A0ACC2GPK2_DALPE|nr:hypothetical protein DPEC_G00145810 [Dallia pectoralis]
MQETHDLPFEQPRFFSHTTNQLEAIGTNVITPFPGSTRRRWREISVSEMEQNEESVRLYLSEEESFLNFADMTPEERLDVWAELMFSQRKLKLSVSELHKALEVADESYTVLRAENTVLCSQNQRMKQTIGEAEKLTDELEDMQTLLSEKDEAMSNLMRYTQKLEQEKVSLVEQIKTISDEMSSIVSAREIDNTKMADLNNCHRSLQVHLEEARVTMAQTEEVVLKKDFANKQLEQSLTEYASIIQDLKEKINALQIQQEEAIVDTVDYMEFNGSVIAGRRNYQSLEQEMSLVPRKMGNPSEEGQEEYVQMEQHVEAVKEKTGLWTHVVRGVKAAGTLTLGLLVPLAVLAATLPISYEHHARGSCMGTFWSAAGSLMEPLCTTTCMTHVPV